MDTVQNGKTDKRRKEDFGKVQSNWDSIDWSAHRRGKYYELYRDWYKFVVDPEWQKECKKRKASGGYEPLTYEHFEKFIEKKKGFKEKVEKQIKKALNGT